MAHQEVLLCIQTEIRSKTTGFKHEHKQIFRLGLRPFARVFAARKAFFGA